MRERRTVFSRLDRIGYFDSQNRPFGFYYCRISLAGPLLGDFCNNIGQEPTSHPADVESTHARISSAIAGLCAPYHTLCPKIMIASSSSSAATVGWAFMKARHEKKHTQAGFAAVVLSLDVAAPVAAGPFEDGIAAYRRGDYPTAMGLLRPLADQGNALAQHNLGFMYLNGHGVAQNYVAGATSSHNGKKGDVR